MESFTIADLVSLAAATGAPLDSRQFVDYLSAVLNARLFAPGEIEVFNHGEGTYTAELAAIGAAKRSIHLEAYLFLRGRVVDAVLAACKACSAPPISTTAPSA